MIGSVPDYDYASRRIDFDSANVIIDIMRDTDRTVDWILVPIVHADHLSARPFSGGNRAARSAMPRRIIPSLRVKMRAGQMPPAVERNGDVCLKAPVNRAKDHDQNDPISRFVGGLMIGQAGVIRFLGNGRVSGAIGRLIGSSDKSTCRE